VPQRVVVEGDLRYLTREQLARARETMSQIASRSLPQTSATLAFTDGMPSMEPTAANHELLRVLDRASRDLGAGSIEAHDPGRRGAGDISFVATIVPGLDGLGAAGENVHAAGEYMDLESLPTLIKRAALLMHRLGE
jgi:glutamate carboxypeptidase